MEELTMSKSLTRNALGNEKDLNVYDSENSFKPPDMPEVITRAVLELTAAFGGTPYDINNGQCEEFALALAEQLSGCLVICTDWEADAPGHFWVFVGGRHYDAEMPEGTEDWKELPIMKRHFGK
jgi:hypothetical protein